MPNLDSIKGTSRGSISAATPASAAGITGAAEAAPPLTKVRPPTEERFRALVESVSDYAIYMLDASGGVVSWNPGAERIKGYREEEVIGKDISLFHAEGETEAARLLLEEAAHEGRVETEGWRVRKDGVRRQRSWDSFG